MLFMVVIYYRLTGEIILRNKMLFLMVTVQALLSV
jgi:hypothetical protein